MDLPQPLLPFSDSHIDSSSLALLQHNLHNMWLLLLLYYLPHVHTYPSCLRLVLPHPPRTTSTHLPAPLLMAVHLLKLHQASHFDNPLHLQQVGLRTDSLRLVPAFLFAHSHIPPLFVTPSTILLPP